METKMGPVSSSHIADPESKRALEIGLADIEVLPDRLRSLRPEIVGDLAESMRVQGLLQPVVLRPAATGYFLVAGRHRFEAARQLKWEAIPARILEIDKFDDALLGEIDENLIRGDLSPAERAAHQARRKQVYERLHPETKHGANQHSRSRKVCDSKNGAADRYTRDAAKKIGRSERSVQQEVKRGQEIVNIERLARTSLDQGEELDALAKLPQPNRDELIARAIAGEKVSAKIEAKKETRARRELELGAIQCALPAEKFGVILADPEWRFEPWSRVTGMDRAADNSYPTSCTEVITARDVPSIAANDCVLFLWATAPMLPHALAVMAAWGFEYKTQVIWRKPKPITGFWFRSVHEILLVGTRGKIPAPAMGTQPLSVIDAPSPGPHSAKPECFLEMTEQLFPTLPKIELNRRGPARPGWAAWGNESVAQSPNKQGKDDEAQRSPRRRQIYRAWPRLDQAGNVTGFDVKAVRRPPSKRVPSKRSGKPSLSAASDEDP
jgi:ParB/RepB/Spo0J family partition protein